MFSALGEALTSFGKALGMLFGASDKDYREQAEEYLKEIKNKMEKFPAGIAEGIAIPHAIGDFANRPAVAVATLNKPLDFGAADGQKCDLVFMIASPDEANAYISLLGQLSVILNNKKLCDRLRRASESGELIDRIMQCEKHLKF